MTPTKPAGHDVPETTVDRIPDPELAKVTAERDEALQYADNIRAQYENLEASEVVNGYKNRADAAESLLASRITAIEAAIEASKRIVALKDQTIFSIEGGLPYSEGAHDAFGRAADLARPLLAQLRSLIAGKETDVG